MYHENKTSNAENPHMLISHQHQRQQIPRKPTKAEEEAGKEIMKILHKAKVEVSAQCRPHP